MPRCASPDHVIVGVVEGSGGSEKVGEQQIAIDQPVNRLIARALFERTKPFAGQRQQIAPPSAPENGDRGQRRVALRGAGEEERTLLAFSSWNAELTTELVPGSLDG